MQQAVVDVSSRVSKTSSNSPLTIPRPPSLYSKEHLLFATDFVLAMAMEFGSSWNPVDIYGYLANRFSSLICFVGIAARILDRTSDEDYESKYESFARHHRDDDDERLALFVDYNKIVFGILVDEYKQGVADLFSHMVFASRMSFVFYERGIPYAPNWIAAFISKALEQLFVKTDGRIYRMLHDFTESVIRNCYQN